MKELRLAIIRMHERGISKHEIARLLDIPHITVRGDIIGRQGGETPDEMVPLNLGPMSEWVRGRETPPCRPKMWLDCHGK